MKLTLSLLCLWSIAQFAALSQEKTESPAWQVAGGVANLCSCVRSNVADQLRLRMKAQLLDEKSLGALLVALEAASNDLVKAQVEKKVNAAAEKMQAISAQAASLLKDAGNQALARELGSEKWRRELLVQAAQAKMLECALAELLGVVGELHAWAGVMQRIVPPSELREALRARLGQLLLAWEKKGLPDGESLKKTSLPPLEASLATQDVVELLRARVAKPVILAFIGAEKRPYGLHPGHVAYLRKTDTPPDVISAMERHDEALCSGENMSR